MGDGGGNGDPYNFSQNKNSLLGKILRLDVENIPTESQILISPEGSNLNRKRLKDEVQQKRVHFVCGETTLSQKAILMLKTKSCNLKYGHLDLEILGAVVLIKKGLHTLCVQMLDRFES
ncbi:hypothetical protein Ancab_035862 [Ancistrocladus abbreviatus]